MASVVNHWTLPFMGALVLVYLSFNSGQALDCLDLWIKPVTANWIRDIKNPLIKDAHKFMCLPDHWLI
jgi:hypothetical protein